MDNVVQTDANTDTNSAQTPSQGAHKQPPLSSSLNPSSLDQDLKEKDPTATREDSYESFFSAYKRVFQRELTPFQIGELGDYIDKDEMPEDLIVHAIKRAGLKGGGIGFVIRILNDYAAAGIKTTEQAKVADKLFDEPKKTRANRPAGNSKPPMKVVKDDGPPPEVSPEELERMLEQARRLKAMKPGEARKGRDEK